MTFSFSINLVHVSCDQFKKNKTNKACVLDHIAMKGGRVGGTVEMSMVSMQ